MPAAASVLCMLAMLASAVMPGMPSNGFRIGVMSFWAARRPPRPSMTLTMPSAKMTAGMSSMANRKPSRAPVPPAPRKSSAFSAPGGIVPNLPFNTLKSNTLSQVSEDEKIPEKMMMAKKKAA